MSSIQQRENDTVAYITNHEYAKLIILNLHRLQTYENKHFSPFGKKH